MSKPNGTHRTPLADFHPIGSEEAVVFSPEPEPSSVDDLVISPLESMPLEVIDGPAAGEHSVVPMADCAVA